MPDIQQFIIDILTNYGWALYPIILGWTFLEGETIVLITGALASEGRFAINVWYLVLFAFLGSFAGDQTYYYIGRRYGTPLLKRWPNLTKRIEWAFHMVRRHETLFILSFRFIYGVRNISPFVIGMAGVGRLKFLLLNMVAALLWANSFAWGGYFLGRALEEVVGEYKIVALLGFVVMIMLIALFGTWRGRVGRRKAEALLAAKEAEGAATAVAKETADAEALDHTATK